MYNTHQKSHKIEAEISTLMSAMKQLCLLAPLHHTFRENIEKFRNVRKILKVKINMLTRSRQFKVNFQSSVIQRSVVVNFNKKGLKKDLSGAGSLRFELIF